MLTQDIVRGRLGCAPCGRRDSSAQITTIETNLEDFCNHTGGVGCTANKVDSSSNSATVGSKRRRSSLAQLTDLLRDLGSKDKDKYRQAVDRGMYTFRPLKPGAVLSFLDNRKT